MEKRIYYHDTDAGGVVYYGTYLKFLEEARTEFLEQRGLNIKDLHKKGLLYAVRKCSITYKAPARYGDIISFVTKIKKLTAAQMVFDQMILDKETQKILVEAEVTLVSLNREFKPTEIHKEFRDALTA